MQVLLCQLPKAVPTAQPHVIDKEAAAAAAASHLYEAQDCLDDLSAVAAQQQQHRRQQPAHHALELPSKLEHQPGQTQHSGRLQANSGRHTT
jgi:hypothetical protein